MKYKLNKIGGITSVESDLIADSIVDEVIGFVLYKPKLISILLNPFFVDVIDVKNNISKIPIYVYIEKLSSNDNWAILVGGSATTYRDPKKTSKIEMRIRINTSRQDYYWNGLHFTISRILRHELGHVKRTHTVPFKLHRPQPEQGLIYDTDPLEVDANIHAIIDYYDSLPKRDRKFMSHDNLVRFGTDDRFYKLFKTDTKFRKKVILRLIREGIVPKI